MPEPPSQDKVARASAWVRDLPSKLRALRGVVRLRPFDTSTEDGRAKERHRRAFWITLTSLASRGLGALTSLVSVPLTVSYLGKERWGMWMTVSAMLVWMTLTDFGMAAGLRNHLAEAYGKDDREAAARHMSGAFYALLSIALVAVGLLFPLLRYLPLERTFEVRDAALLDELRPTIAAVLLVFLAQFPLNVVGQAYAAYQRTHVSNLFGIVGSVLSLGVLLVVIRLKLGLPWLIAATGGFGVVLTTVNFLYLLHDLPHLRPRLGLVSRAGLRELAAVSLPLMLFQLSSLLINEGQILVMARASGFDAVADYSIFTRVFSVPVFVFAMVEAPYGPMLREAFVRGDARWFRDTFFGLLRFKLGLTALATVLLLTLANPLAKALSGSAVAFDRSVWALASLLLLVGIWNGTYTILFTAVNRLWTLVATIVPNGLVTVGLTYWLAPRGIGWTLVATMAFSYAVTAWLMPVLSRSIFAEAADRTASPGATPAPSAAAEADV